MFEVIFILSILVPYTIYLVYKNKKLSLENMDLKLDKAAKAEEKRFLDEKIELLQSDQTRLIETFKSLSYDTLQKNNEHFVELASEVFGKFHEKASGHFDQNQMRFLDQIKPIKESIEKFDHKLIDLEKSRMGAYSSLVDQVKHLHEIQAQLRVETKNLVTALKAPLTRGRWGEVQLKRVVEMAGMLNHCDFFEQEHVEGQEGRLRPDMVIQLPEGKKVVVDAKAPLSAYLEALECSDDEMKLMKLKEHAKQVRSHVMQLSKKSYWDHFKDTPEFVILFIPGEIFFNAALEQDPSLIEIGMDHKVIIATPTTLIALLRSIAISFRQEKLSKNAEEISDLGAELYKRLTDFTDYFGKTGKALNQAVTAYNKAVGTLESRVFVSARKFNEINQKRSTTSLDQLVAIEVDSRDLQIQESL